MTLDLDVPGLAEAAHREPDEQDLDRDDDQRDQAEDVRVERRVVEAVLVAREPLGPETAAKISRMIASAAVTGSMPLRQRAM